MVTQVMPTHGLVGKTYEVRGNTGLAFFATIIIDGAIRTKNLEVYFMAKKITMKTIKTLMNGKLIKDDELREIVKSLIVSLDKIMTTAEADDIYSESTLKPIDVTSMEFTGFSTLIVSASLKALKDCCTPAAWKYISDELKEAIECNEA